jgi:hydrogenase nickel incorporation protein HypB
MRPANAVSKTNTAKEITMCATCGCGGHDVLIGGKRPTLAKIDQPLIFRQSKNSTEIRPPSEPVTTRLIQVERDLLAKNDALAANNRQQFSANNLLVLNLVSSPGSGKTTLLVRTLLALKATHNLAVIEGDQQTENDAERIRATGVPAIQINTGKGCHLDALMIEQAFTVLPAFSNGLLFIENVGNLVCPASFDLGEAAKVVVLSVTEGEDKPLKYPDMFRAARLMLLNKCDLLPYLNFDVALSIANARRVNPDIEIIQLSASHGEGMAQWIDWLNNTYQAQTLTRAPHLINDQSR